ncbi:LacI family transcriptional regulator [Actinocatenispora thailandica]|uniref:LacI family transcriptional regulator n=1 Tax=Actinocatenispora thailandica TaxID=227318 RepID=A0A7R7DR58_9ACTN|nr:LacI family DNA-binding transcriptional regulator [Actinocatenispora thailandica]BCJ36284.1 LacI family transcriptional regulator [Actinocatenispora thailandica]
MASQEPRAPGLKDVAAAAKVSWKTVSNVVNGTGRVSEQTRRRVEEAIRRLGYRPSVVGRQLRSGRTGILALAVPEIDHPYFCWLAQATINAARARGYRVFIDQTGGKRAAEAVVARGYDERLFDGIVFSPLELSLSEAVELERDTPLVLLGERSVGASGAHVDHVSIDNLGAARDAVHHLVATGRRRLVFVGAEPGGPDRTGALRLQGFHDGLRANGLSPDPTMERPVNAFTRSEGAHAIEALLPRIDQVDGILCANDQLALGALHALRTNGIRVPDDIGVVGWDNIEDGRYSNPTLTTIAPDVEGIAESAVARVLAMIDGAAVEPADVVAPYRLLARESTAVPGS